MSRTTDFLCRIKDGVLDLERDAANIGRILDEADVPTHTNYGYQGKTLSLPERVQWLVQDHDVLLEPDTYVTGKFEVMPSPIPRAEFEAQVRAEMERHIFMGIDSGVAPSCSVVTPRKKPTMLECACLVCRENS